MGETLETARLLLAPWSDADAALLARLASDPVVVRYVGDGRCWPDDRVAGVSGDVVEHWRANGFGCVAERLGMSHELDSTGRFGERVAVYRR